MQHSKENTTVITNTEGHNYIIAMIKEGKDTVITPLNTGKRYTRAEAMAKAETLNVTCQFELKRLDHDRFIAYSICSE